MAADSAIARLRAGELTGTAASEPLPDWRAPATFRADRHEKLSWSAIKGPFATHWPLLWPHSPGHAVSHARRELRKEVEHEPTAYEPSVLVPLLAWLTQPSVEVGDWTAAAITFGLGSRVALHRAAAVDALLALDHDGRLPVGGVAACVLAAGEAEVIKLNRVAGCLTDLLPAAPGLTRDLALGLLPATIECRHRDAHRFLTVAADAVATAGRVALPAAVVEVASRDGRTKLVTEARRLVAL